MKVNIVNNVKTLLCTLAVISVMLTGCTGNDLLSQIERIVDEANVPSAEDLIPAAPENLSASASDSSRIDLNWTDMSDNETSFQVQHSIDRTNWSTAVVVDFDNTTCSDTGLTDGTTYFYRICSVNDAGSSEWSNTASAATLSLGSVIYKANYADSGEVPEDTRIYEEGQTVTVLDNTGGLVRAQYTFTGWNTKADGSGTSYTAGEDFTMGSSGVILYAQWFADQYWVLFEGNGNDAGAAPADAQYDFDAHVTVPGAGTLTKSGYRFTEWNTALNGSGDGYTAGATLIMDSSDVTLYAQWDNRTALWAQSILSGGSESLFYGVDTDSSDNIYAAGYQYGTLTYSYGSSVAVAGKYSSENIGFSEI